MKERLSKEQIIERMQAIDVSTIGGQFEYKQLAKQLKDLNNLF